MVADTWKFMHNFFDTTHFLWTHLKTLRITWTLSLLLPLPLWGPPQRPGWLIGQWILQAGGLFSYLLMQGLGSHEIKPGEGMPETGAGLWGRTCLLQNSRTQRVDLKSEDKLWAFLTSFSFNTKIPFCLPPDEMQTSSLQTEKALLAGPGWGANTQVAFLLLLGHTKACAQPTSSQSLGPPSSPASSLICEVGPGSFKGMPLTWHPS